MHCLRSHSHSAQPITSRRPGVHFHITVVSQGLALVITDAISFCDGASWRFITNGALPIEVMLPVHDLLVTEQRYVDGVAKRLRAQRANGAAPRTASPSHTPL